MAFDTIQANEDMNAANVQQIIDALSGVSGGGQVISITQPSDSSNYALDVRNLDTTNSYALRVRDASSNVLLIASKNNLQLGTSPANDVMTINCNISGKVFIGDSANASLTVGLTINQAGNDDEIISLKSSDVAHGVTTITETDTFGRILKQTATEGGLRIEGLAEGTTGLLLEGTHGTDNTTKSTAGTGCVIISGSVKSGTDRTTVGADANLVAVRSQNTTRFILDGDGDSHQDGTGWTTYDDHDDVALLDMCNAALLRARDPVKENFWQWAGENARKLQDLKLITFNEDGHHFVNRSKMQELLVGAMRQTGQRIADIERENAALRAQITEIHRMLVPPLAGV